MTNEVQESRLAQPRTEANAGTSDLATPGKGGDADSIQRLKANVLPEHRDRIAEQFRAVLGELAGGAVIDLDAESRPRIRVPVPNIEGPTWDELLLGGWLVSTPNGGGYKLSDAGLIAFNRGSDEMGDGRLMAPAKSVTP